jgi:hypothetical protein
MAAVLAAEAWDTRVMLAWIIIGAIVVAILVGLLVFWRSLGKWQGPPPGDEGRSTLTWMTFSQGDQSGGAS